jgi:hypothetical protein
MLGLGGVVLDWVMRLEEALPSGSTEGATAITVWRKDAR